MSIPRSMHAAWWAAALLATVVAALLTTIVAAPAWAARAKPALLPDADTTWTLPGLAQPARIVTDHSGIPHVQAATLPDLYFAWGFVTARDRLAQLEFMRRSARGEMWRWVGNRSLLADGGAQLFELQARAERIWERDRADAELARSLEAYTAGINAYLALCRSGARPWPPEFRRLGREPLDFAPVDVVLALLTQGLVLDLSVPELSEAEPIRKKGAEEFAIRRRFEGALMVTTIPDSAARSLYGDGASLRAPRPDATPSGARPTPIDRLLARARRTLAPWLPSPDVGPERASNVFAVGPDRSASGAPLLANDPHLALGTPGPLHVIHVEVPGVVDAIGACVPGLPVIVSGRNRECAWGITALSADVMDVYADTLSRDRRSVRWQGGWAPLRKEPYRMSVRMLKVLPLPPLGHSRVYTPHGPVLAVDKKRGIALSLRWAADDSAVTLARFVGFERSNTAAELAERMRTLVTPGINLVAADRGGDVRYQTAGRLPRRDWEVPFGPVPGGGDHEWSGFVSPDAMPAWQPPRSGFVVNSNNLPVGDAYPVALPRYEWPHDRAARIGERLAGDSSVTVADMMSIQNDVVSRAASRLVPLLIAAAESLAETLDARERAVLDTLRAWDFSARRERVAPTLYRAWYGALQRRSRLEGLMGLATAALDGRAPEALRTPGKETPERAATAAVGALRLAMVELGKKLGPNLSRWKWERAHLARFPNVMGLKDSSLAARTLGIDGDNATPSVAPSALPWRLGVVFAPVFRHVVDLASPDSSLGIVVPGNSGLGPHRDDLARRWANHGYVRLDLNWDRIEANRESEWRLTP